MGTGSAIAIGTGIRGTNISDVQLKRDSLYGLLVQYLGSGLVLHQTDFGGCQTLLNERRRRRQRKKYVRMFGITVTPQSFYAVDKLTGVSSPHDC